MVSFFRQQFIEKPDFKNGLKKGFLITITCVSVFVLTKRGAKAFEKVEGLTKKTRSWNDFLLEPRYLISNLGVITGVVAGTCASAAIIYLVKQNQDYLDLLTLSF